MKLGKDINALVTELHRQLETKRDFKAPAARLALGVNGFYLNGVGEFGVRDTAHDQIGEYLEIPKRYYERMRKDMPHLLVENVNTWLKAKGPETRLVRTLDGDVRALLSDRYRPLDNYDLVQAVLPILTGDDDYRVASCEVTEKRLYIQVVNERMTANVRRGDIVQAGIVISNSEIGDGSLRIEPMVYRVVCTNGLIAGNALRKYHVGRAGTGDLDNAVEFYRDETRKADDTAFWMKVSDAVRGAFDETRFLALVRKMEEATSEGLKAEVDLPAIVEVVGTRYGFSEAEKKIAETHFLRGADFTRFGVLNAVTRTAQDVESYDRAIEFERFGGDILELPKTEWEKMERLAFRDGELVKARR